MPRETAEEKIARIVRETMDGQRRAEEEKKNPQLGQLRQLIREELGSVLGDLLNDKGDAGSPSRKRRQTDDNESEGGGDILTSLFGG